MRNLEILHIFLEITRQDSRDWSVKECQRGSDPWRQLGAIVIEVPGSKGDVLRIGPVVKLEVGWTRGFANIAKDQGCLELPEFLQVGEMAVKYLGTEVKNSEQNDLLHSKAFYLKIK